MHYLYNEKGVRMTLVRSSGGQGINWLFLPGGPGIDSSYLLSLVQNVTLPGNIWFLDLPGNGSNKRKEKHFEDWQDIFVPSIAAFSHPVLVGHSFGGAYPLLFPELEEILHGFVILNSAPCLWIEAAKKFGKEHNLPDFSKEIPSPGEEPTQESATKMFRSNMPYYFAPQTLREGEEWILQFPFAYAPAIWWKRWAINTPFAAKWIPQKVPTLIIGGELDGMTPLSLFTEDRRFARPNIELQRLAGAGHFPWFEKPREVGKLLQHFAHSQKCS